MSCQNRLDLRRTEVQYGRTELVQVLVGDFAHDLFAALRHGDEVPHIVPVVVILLLRLLDSQSLALEVVLDDDCALVPLQLDVRIGRADCFNHDADAVAQLVAGIELWDFVELNDLAILTDGEFQTYGMLGRQLVFGLEHAELEHLALDAYRGPVDFGQELVEHRLAFPFRLEEEVDGEGGVVGEGIPDVVPYLLGRVVEVLEPRMVELLAGDGVERELLLVYDVAADVEERADPAVYVVADVVEVRERLLHRPASAPGVDEVARIVVELVEVPVFGDQAVQLLVEEVQHLVKPLVQSDGGVLCGAF